MTQSVFAQVGVSGDVQFFSKNASLATGFVYDETPAIILHLNADYQIPSSRFGVSGFYTGHTSRKETGVVNHYHLVDICAHYNITNGLVIYAGPELIYKHTDGNKIDVGLLGMITWSKEKFATSFIIYTNPQFQFFYYIGSANINVCKNVSIYTLGAYTTAEQFPVYGLSGLKYSNGKFFTGAYYVFRKDAPGPTFHIGFTF